MVYTNTSPIPTPPPTETLVEHAAEIFYDGGLVTLDFNSAVAGGFVSHATVAGRVKVFLSWPEREAEYVAALLENIAGSIRAKAEYDEAPAANPDADEGGAV